MNKFEEKEFRDVHNNQFKESLHISQSKMLQGIFKIKSVAFVRFERNRMRLKKKGLHDLETRESQLGAFAAAAKSLLKQSPCQLVLVLRELVIPQRTEDNTGLLDVLPIRLLSGHPTEGFGLRQTVSFLNASHGLVRRNKSSPHFMTHRLPTSICEKRKKHLQEVDSLLSVSALIF